MTTLWSSALAPEVDFVNGYKISRNDPLHRVVIGRIYHWFVKLAFGSAPARRGLRLPAHAPRRVREGGAHPLLGRHLRRAHEEGPGPRLPHRRGARAPLPPQLRQEPVLQLPAGGPHPRRPRPALDRSRGARGAPEAGGGRRGRPRGPKAVRDATTATSTAGARSSSPAGWASSAATSAAPSPTSGPRSWPWTACSPTTAATSSTSPATRRRSASTSRTCAATAWSTWSRARTCSSTWPAR